LRLTATTCSFQEFIQICAPETKTNFFDHEGGGKSFVTQFSWIKNLSKKPKTYLFFKGTAGVLPPLYTTACNFVNNILTDKSKADSDSPVCEVYGKIIESFKF
jgi:hypothetical protein